MRVSDRFGMSGELRLVVWHGDVSDAEALAHLDGFWLPRRIVDDRIFGNLITNTGRSDITSRIINGASVTIPGWIAATQTAIVPAATDTVLTGETARKAVSTVAVLSTYYQRYVATFTSADLGAVTVTGAGLFTAAAAGSMWAIVSTSVAKSATDSLVAEWRIQSLAS